MVTYDETSEDGKGKYETRQLREGDFLGFAAGLKVARKLVNEADASEELRYLVGGSRPEVDVVHYPTTGGGGGKRLVIDRTGTGKRWWVDGDAVDENDQ